MNIIDKIINEKINSFLINETLNRTLSGIEQKLKKLNPSYRHTRAFYDGEREDTIYMTVPYEKFQEYENEYYHWLNLYNYVEVKHSFQKNHQDIYTGDIYDAVYIQLEPKFGLEQQNIGFYYHATTPNKVNKILKQGLCPKDNHKLNDNRGSRIYLSKRYNSILFQQVTGNIDYVVLNINLEGYEDKIKLYTDEQANDSVYTYDNIPPQCISIGRNFDKEEHDNLQSIKNQCQQIIGDNNAQAIMDGIFQVKIEGMCPNNITNFQLKIYPKPYVRYGWQKNFNIEGKRYRFKNGKKITTTIRKGFDTIKALVKYFNNFYMNC